MADRIHPLFYDDLYVVLMYNMPDMTTYRNFALSHTTAGRLSCMPHVKAAVFDSLCYEVEEHAVDATHHGWCSRKTGHRYGQWTSVTMSYTTTINYIDNMKHGTAIQLDGDRLHSMSNWVWDKQWGTFVEWADAQICFRTITDTGTDWTAFRDGRLVIYHGQRDYRWTIDGTCICIGYDDGDTLYSYGTDAGGYQLGHRIKSRDNPSYLYHWDEQGDFIVLYIYHYYVDRPPLLTQITDPVVADNHLQAFYNRSLF